MMTERTERTGKMGKMKFPTGPTAGIRVSGTHSRGQYFRGVAAMVGTPPKDALLFMSYPVMRDAPEVACAYQAVGFDNSANYVP